MPWVDRTESWGKQRILYFLAGLQYISDSTVMLSVPQMPLLPTSLSFFLFSYCFKMDLHKLSTMEVGHSQEVGREDPHAQ